MALRVATPWNGLCTLVCSVNVGTSSGWGACMEDLLADQLGLAASGVWHVLLLQRLHRSAPSNNTGKGGKGGMSQVGVC